MAFMRVTVGVQDGQGLKATSRAWALVADASTLTELDTAIAAWGALYNNVTGGRIRYIECAVFNSLSGITPNTPDGSIRVQDNAVLKFPVAPGGSPFAFLVPGLKTALKSGNNLVYTEGNPVDLLADVMELPFTVHASNDSNWTDEEQNDLAAIAAGALAFRKAGHQLSKSKHGGV